LAGDIERCKRAGFGTIGCNDNWIFRPDWLYAPDIAWIKGTPAAHSHPDKWTCDQRVASELPGWQYIAIDHTNQEKGLSFDPFLIHHGSNAGYQMLNIAFLSGASRIILLGYDMQRTNGQVRWKGLQPKGIEKTSPASDKFAGWRASLATMVPDFERAGVEVVNCSRATALMCFRRASLEAVLS
jgi:hypothetical protein